MAAVAGIFGWRPRPGRMADFLQAAAKARSVHHRLGAKVRMWNTQYGGEPGVIGYVVEHGDWKQFGEFSAKLESDREWLALVAEWGGNREPIADLVRSSFVVELPVG